ncbi:hypothetical protein HUW46_08219 [Amycolatopsis sp. CA-230715]|nr:hypothetical protein HUW46_08219 [Amycolatopsis sp. CA-230715]
MKGDEVGRFSKRQLGVVVAAAFAVTMAVPIGAAVAAPGPVATAAGTGAGLPDDDRPSPEAKAQRQRAADALEREILSGGRQSRATGEPGTVDSLKISGTHKVFVLAVEFGDKTTPEIGGPAGPVHNGIPKPDPKKDNGTYWVPDFNQAHYQKLLFGDQQPSFKDFYRQQSQGRFGVEGQVTNWVKVPYSEAYYTAQGSMDKLISDGFADWVAQRKAGGATDADIKKELAQYDNWNRAKHLDQPDGQLDHLMVLHAGVGAETFGSHLDPRVKEVIWSHSSATDKPVAIGTTGVAASDYTIEPENAGVGVLAHEFGHDLGLPDFYDYSGNGCAEDPLACQDNATGFWTVMSGGSWLSNSDKVRGTAPGGFGPWEKLMLGWLDYQAVRYGQEANVRIDAPNAKQGANPQALVVILPPGQDGKGRYYLVENRRNIGYDQDLQHAYFNSYGATLFQRFAYQPGMLVWYWNRAQKDNNVSEHRGAGQVLPVDARVSPIISDDGRAIRPRVQMYDAAFTLSATKPLNLTWDNTTPDGVKYTAKVTQPAQPAQPTFDDRNSWYDPRAWRSSVDVPKTGTVISLFGEQRGGRTVDIGVSFPGAH